MLANPAPEGASHVGLGKQNESIDALCFQGELRRGQIERHLTLRSGQAGVY